MTVKKYRIRPPGSTDEKFYRWRLINGEGEKQPAQTVAAEGVLKPKVYTGDLEGEGWQPAGVFKVDGIKLNVEQRTVDETMLCRCKVTYESEEEVKDILKRLEFPDDTTQGENVTRVVKWPFLLHTITYNLIRKEYEKDGVTHVTYKTDTTKQSDGAYFNTLVKISKTDDKITLEVYEGSVSGLIPICAQERKKPEGVAMSVRRMMLGGDFVNGKFGGHIDGMLEAFAAACDDEKQFTVSKTITVDKISPGHQVPLYRRPEGKTSYAAFRAEAEMKGTVALFIKMLENLGAGGFCKSKLTPENESQEVLVEDGVSRIVRKVDKLGPWPLKKREYLFASVLGFRQDGTLYLCQKSFTDDKKYPVSQGCVRGLFHEVGFRCVPTSPGKIKVMQLVHADPLGMPRAAVEDKAALGQPEGLGGRV